MRSFRFFALSGTVAATFTALLGSWVRISGAGLACPDWPLCHGALVPVLQGGVLLEWSHRAAALVVSLLAAGTAVTGWRLRHRVAGLGPALAALAAVFALQVMLGGLTVKLANSPLSVALHWGTAMALLGVFATLATLALLGAAPRRLEGSALGPALAAALAFATMCVGAYVSSSHAGLACPAFPACDGTLVGRDGAQFVQMLHRTLAAALAGVAIFTLLARPVTPSRVRAFAGIGALLVALQIALGAANVLWALPVAARAAHAAVAPLIFIAFVVAATLAAFEPVRTEALPPAAGPQPAGATGA